MDRNKQLKKLVKDAAVDDFIIEVNKNKENVNIICSTGFYSTVAIPTLQSLSKSRANIFDGISVQCKDIIGNLDITRAHQTTILYFQFSKNTDSVGGVRIHMHHTTRKVQLQGGAIMPDKTTAPVWFANNVLKNQFAKEAREKAAEIQTVNQTVTRLVEPNIARVQTPDTCKGCDAPFNGRSTPEYCRQCGFFYHKYKCFPTSRHPCQGKNISESSESTRQVARRVVPTHTVPDPTLAIQPPPLQAVVPPPPTQAATVPLHQVTLATLTPSASSTGTTPRTSTATMCESQPTSTSSNRAVSHNSSLVPSQPHMLSRLQHRPTPEHNQAAQGAPLGPDVPTQSQEVVYQDRQNTARGLNPHLTPHLGITESDISNTEYVPRKQAAKKKRPIIATDPAEVALEFYKVEISTLQARLQKLEVEVKDLKFRNSILMARNKTLEQSKSRSIHDQYFPPQPDPTPTPPSPKTGRDISCSHHVLKTGSCCAPHFCAPPPPCTQLRTCQTTLRGDNSCSQDEVASMVLELRVVVDALKNQIDKLVNTEQPAASIPQPTSTPAQSHSGPDNVSSPSQTGTPTTRLPSESPTVSLDGFMFGEEDQDLNLN